MKPSLQVETGHLTHYEVLDLSSNSHPNPKELKSAYHQALLRHHPDKAPQQNGHGSSSRSLNNGSGGMRISIDRLSAAYQTLSDPKLKAEYDRLLATQRYSDSNGALVEKAHHVGVDVVDLEDMEFDEGRNVWRRDCRCGDKRAYEVREAELEREQSHGELYVGCPGCSLFIKVVFQAVEEDEDTIGGDG